MPGGITNQQANHENQLKVMGDRGNIAVIQDRQPDTNQEQVWFYTHWSGSSLEDTVAEALGAVPGRWSDYSYLARAIFCRLVPQDQWREETGYGISTRIGDNEHDIIVVDCPRQRVYMIAEGQLNDGRVPTAFNPKKTWTFQRFAATPTKA